MITINAENKALGRLASEIAIYLIGKHKPNYAANKNTGEEVKVINVNKFKITGKKVEQKTYYKHTNYIGHLKHKKISNYPKAEILKKAIWNMLPKNKLREQRMRLLKIVSA
jgi:large subunit ribosomal protein L13